MEGKIKFLAKNSNAKINPGFFEQNSWVNFTVLDVGVGYKVKRIEVLPRKHLSFQNNKFYAEHWTIVQGTAKVTLNDRTFSVNAGETIDFEVGEMHFVENPDNLEILVFINVQCGFNLKDDDFILLSEGLGKMVDTA